MPEKKKVTEKAAAPKAEKAGRQEDNHQGCCNGNQSQRQPRLPRHPSTKVEDPGCCKTGSHGS